MVTSAPPLVFEHLAKSFGSVRAVDDLTFTVRPGAVTGFLGPNGAGKTTTLRVLLGLAAASKGRALVGDRPYEAYDRPGTVVGAALETSGLHPGRTGLGHLEVYAPQVGASRARCREVLEEVELGFAARRRAGTYSLGMRQRLALATALLADPPVLVLDEPTNGLDPEGIVWLRGLLRRFADEGRTVLVSSHLLAEVQASVDDVVVIAQGRLRHASSLDALRELAVPAAYVETPMTTQLTALAAGEGWQLSPHERGFLVTGAQAAQVGRAAHVAGLELHQLVSHGGNLEEAFFALTRPEPAPSSPPPADARPVEGADR